MPNTRRPSPQDERKAREARRLRAAELFAQDCSQAEVARELDVSRQSAHVWHARFAQGGVDALRSRGPERPRPQAFGWAAGPSRAGSAAGHQGQRVRIALAEDFGP
jgi:hypothetical protein